MKFCFSESFIYFAKSWVFLILLLSLQNSLISQEYAAEQFTIKEGLPSNEIFDLFQDRDGFIWIGTDKGASRFDGSEFTYLTTKDGIADNDVLSINQDCKGKIWFLSYNGQLSFWKEGKVFNARNTSLLENINAGNYFHNFLEDSRKNLWFGTSKSGWLRFDSSFNSVNTKYLAPGTDSGGTYYFFEKALDSMFLVSKKTIFKYSNNQFIPFAALPEVHNKSRFYYLKENGILYFTTANEVFAYQLSENNFLWKKTIIDAEQINSIEVLSDGLLYVATDNGFHSFSLDGLKLKSYLKGKITSDVLIDRENNLWAATLSSGMYLIRNRNVINYSTEPLFSIETSSDSLFFGGTGPKIHYASKGNIGLHKYRTQGLKSISNQDRVKILRKGPNNKLWIGTAKGLYRIEENKTELIYHSTVYDFFFYNQYLYVASNFGLIRLDSAAIESIKSIYQANSKEKNISVSTSKIIINYIIDKKSLTNFSKVNSGLLLFGSKDTIYEFSDSKLIPWLGISEGEIIQNEGNDVGELWFLDKWKGLFYFDKKTDSLSNISLDTLKSGVEYNSFFVDTDNIVWVASSIGLFKVEKIKNNSFVSLIGASEGLVNKEVNEVKIFRDTIWLATSAGITYFPKSIFRDSIAPILYMDSIQLNGNFIQDSSIVKSASSNNILTIFLSSISFKDKKSTLYQYKLEGIIKDSGSFSTSTFTLMDLPPSNYKLSLYAADASGNRSPKRVFSFSIKTPWWYNKVLWSAILLIPILGFVLLIRKRRQYQNLVEKNSISKPSITVKSVLDGSKVQIYLDELLYIKGAKDYLEIFSEEKKIMVRITMKAFLKNLDDAPEFIRVHKSYIINSQKVSSYKSDNLHIGDEIIPIGRSFQNKVKAFFDSSASD